MFLPHFSVLFLTSRWHAQIERVVQSWRDQHLSRYVFSNFLYGTNIYNFLNRYRREDFNVGGGLEVLGVSSVLQHENHELHNLLVTFMEVKELALRENVMIRYNRLNHASFQWRLDLGNPERSRRRVIVRIFIAALNTPGDPSSFTNSEPVLMDKFVHNLSGEERETLVRESMQNTLSMVDSGLTVERLSESITGEQGEGTNTWCGIPINLYLPKSSEEGRDFCLMAFVNDVEQDVEEGLDGVQHVMCGHKEIDMKMDSRSFGFPFDREFDFNLHSATNHLSSFAHNSIRIVHRRNIMQEGGAAWEDVGRLQPGPLVHPSMKNSGQNNRTITENQPGNETLVNNDTNNRTSTDEKPTNETPVNNNNNNEPRNENTNPQGNSGQGMSSSEPSEQSASEKTTNEQSGQSEHSNGMDDENGKLLELLQPKPNQIHNPKTITSTVRTEYSDAEKNQGAPNQHGGTTIRPATTVAPKTKEQEKNVQESKGHIFIS